MAAGAILLVGGREVSMHRFGGASSPIHKPLSKARIRACRRYDDWLRLREVDQDLTFGQYLRDRTYARDWRTPR
jgi:hypothetical protein